MRKKKLPPIPPPSRLDSLSESDLFQALESALSAATHMVTTYRHNPGDREMALAHLERYVDESAAVTKAMRRKYAPLL
jgi:hypothetical protein